MTGNDCRLSLHRLVHGKRQAVVVSYAEWEWLSTVPSFGRLLMAAPLTTDDLPSRNSSGLRTSEL
jgi:antitoxin Phd